MEFEFREEQTIRHSNGVVEVKEIVIARRPADQIKEVFHDMEVGHRRNLNKSGEMKISRIHSVVRVK